MVTIPDPALRRAVESKLGKGAGEHISPEEAGSVESLALYGASVGSLAGLEHFTGSAASPPPPNSPNARRSACRRLPSLLRRARMFAQEPSVC